MTRGFNFDLYLHEAGDDPALVVRTPNLSLFAVVRANRLRRMILARKQARKWFGLPGFFGPQRISRECLAIKMGRSINSFGVVHTMNVDKA